MVRRSRSSPFSVCSIMLACAMMLAGCSLRLEAHLSGGNGSTALPPTPVPSVPSNQVSPNTYTYVYQRPLSGELRSDDAETHHYMNRLVSDFMLDLTFRNNGSSSRPWEISIPIRYDSANEVGYFLRIRSTGDWYFDLIAKNFNDVFPFPVSSGKISNLSSGYGEPNALRFIAQGSVGEFVLNGQRSGRLSMTDKMSPGLLAIRAEAGAIRYDELMLAVPVERLASVSLSPRHGSLGPTRNIVPVSSSQPWTFTYMNVRAGEIVHIRHTGGSWRECEICTDVGAMGSDRFSESLSEVCYHAALVASIGETFTCVGSEVSLVAQATGPIWLGINDVVTDDNYGSLDVEIWIE